MRKPRIHDTYSAAAEERGVSYFGFDGLAGRNRGQALIEYALIMVLLVLVIFGGLIVFGPQLASIYQHISNVL